MTLTMGAFLGVLNARYLFVGSWMSLVTWTVVGVLIGYWNQGFHPAALGAGFGFVLSFAFMCAGYSGAAPLPTRILPFAALGLFGGVCGAILGAVGGRVKRARRVSGGRAVLGG